MKINRIDLGHNPLRAPSYQQMLGDVVVEHATTISYERGAGPREMSVVVWVQAQTAIAGYPAGSQGANEALARWLEELATNPDLNDPVLVNWSSLRALPQDGWWHIVNCVPNYQWTGAGRIPVSMTFRQRGALGAPVCTYWGGGALPSAYTAVPQNLVGLPQNASGVITGARVGAEGGYPFVLNPPAAAGGSQGIVEFLESAAYDDWVKAGSHLYDAMGPIGSNGVPTGTPSNLLLFHSIGSEPGSTGTLNAWQSFNGAPASIASHVVTIPGNSQISSGHLEWWDGKATGRFKWVTGGVPTMGWHVDRRSVVSDYSALYAWCDGINLLIIKHVFGGGFTTVSQVACPLVNNTQYWMEIGSVGTTVTARMYADTAGAQTTLLAQVSATVAEVALQVGCIWLGTNSATALDWGGNFANVLTVTGPAPPGWTIAQGTGEPAWCWSRSKSFSGGSSLSIYNAYSDAQAWWQSPTMSTLASTPYVINVYCLGLTGSAPTNFYPSINFSSGGPNVVCDSAWHLTSAIPTPGANQPAELIGYGAGTFYFDVVTVTGIGGSPVLLSEGFEPAGLANSLWLEVLGLEHSYTGDLVFTNGLLMVTVSLNGSVQLYAWTRTGIWAQVGAIQTVDNAGNVGVPMAVQVWKVGYEEIGLDVTYIGAAHSTTVSMRLQRGHRILRLGLTPKSYDNVSDSSIRFVPSVGGALIVFNETIAADQQAGAGFLAATATYPYGAGYVVSSAWPFVVSLLYQGATGQVPTKQPGYGGVGAGLNLGDTSGPSQYGTRLYGIGVTPFTGPQTLQGYAGSGSKGGSWVAFNDSGSGGFGTNQAKLPSATSIASHNDSIVPSVVLPAGVYRAWFRMRAGSAGTPGPNTNYGVYSTGPEVVAAVPTLTTNYVLYSPGTFTADGVKGYYAFTSFDTGGGNTTRDWFVDEAFFVPVTQTLFKDGPQELAQQYLFERTTRHPVV